MSDPKVSGVRPVQRAYEDAVVALAERIYDSTDQEALKDIVEDGCRGVRQMSNRQLIEEWRLQFAEELQLVDPDTNPNREAETGKLVSFDAIPLGARFRYPGGDAVWVKLQGSGHGLIARWDGPVLNYLGQPICSFEETVAARLQGRVELTD